MSKRFLAVVHQEMSVTGRIGHSLAARGWAEDKRAPAIGQALPGDPRDHDAVIVFGGPQSAFDDDPALKIEHDYVEQVMKAGVPLLGVCLGAQIMARVMGAEVARHPDEESEIGYFPVRKTGLCNGLFPEEMHVYHWHRDGFDLPKSATLLAKSDGAFPNQAFRASDTAYGIQFHPEVTGEMLQRWCASGPEGWQQRKGAQSPELQTEGYHAHHQRLGDWLEDFFDHWLSD